MLKIDPQWRTFFTRQDTLVDALRLIGWARFVRANRDSLPPHHHGSAYEIHVLTRGRLDVVVSEGVKHLRAGQALFTRPREIHSGLGSVIQQSEFYWIQLSSEHLEPWHIQLLDQLCDRRTVAVDNRTIDRFQRLLNEHLNQDPYSRNSSKALLDLLIIKLGRCLSPDFTSSSREVSRVKERLRENLEEPPKTHSLARELGVSPTLLARRFKDEVGESIAKWFLHERLDIACNLLEQGISTREIARSLGYSSAQNFATTFRRELGSSPSQFREVVRTGAASFLPETALEFN